MGFSQTLEQQEKRTSIDTGRLASLERRGSLNRGGLLSAQLNAQPSDDADNDADILLYEGGGAESEEAGGGGGGQVTSVMRGVVRSDTFVVEQGNGIFVPRVCNACPACGDTCGVVGCGVCGGVEADAESVGDLNKAKGRRDLRQFTYCQVLRHRNELSLWLVAKGQVFDATEFMHDHPVGPLPMLRGADRDNTEDMEMHSPAAHKVWKKLRIGHLKPCPKEGYGYFLPPPNEKCVIM